MAAGLRAALLGALALLAMTATSLAADQPAPPAASPAPPAASPAPPEESPAPPEAGTPVPPAGARVPPVRRPPARRAPGLVIGDAPRLGPDDAPVTIVEFSDFQCHFCARAATTLQQLSRAYAGQVRIVFKHYPLSSHPGAPLAHEASLAAHAQGKFWEMHRLLMANQTRQTRAHLVEYAQQIGLDVEAFTQALDSRQFRGKVMSDVSEGRRIFVGMTPTYFINGRRFVGAQPLSAFRSAVERALSAARPAATE